ncbi:dTDP-4-dehydrorhamnose 3,5-epimerase family protein [Thiocapsa roseopersicina]|uniref:dTDP-4-dehydrorhamnose 3,5-epimerase n=1 Tax=Thiocapsa roseopersicina TaxID=1058 RepID=A0A1H2WCT6_THIRO|nr:dTDP-4-dehydrorhamnose 3,5-epimerase family protein [Thiocapsa roseopersicina]SDW78296.1 dTDP-4-dehydrorhamnose 3,5-epimerase [Thiocapsa roseopersicina]
MTNPLSRLIAGRPLEGAELHRIAAQKDRRGSFAEIFQEHWGSCIAPVQWSFVRSEPEVLRGMHLHLRHDEYFCCLEGKVFLGLRDLRGTSPTRDQWSLYELHGEDPAALTFPRGILHGWYFPERSLHIQAVSEAYCDYGGDDNWGCHWADPELQIPWPQTHAILSDSAANFPTLQGLRACLSDATDA